MVSPRRWLQRQPAHRRIAAAVGLFYYLASLFILRDVVAGIPSVLGGSSVINGDELVPYFNPQSQLLDQAKGEIRDQYLDCSRATDVLGWQPTHALSEGLAKTYAWYKDYLTSHPQ